MGGRIINAGRGFLAERRGGHRELRVKAVSVDQPNAKQDAYCTKATFVAEYTVPVPLLGKLAESLIVKQNEREAEMLLANVKARMEAQG